MTRRACLAVAISLAALISASPPRGQSHQAFGWFHPWIEIDERDLRDMADGQIVSQTLAGSGSEIVVFFAGVISTNPAAFMDAVAHPQRLWKSEKVERLGRFSTPPRLDDVESLRLSERDVEAIRRCVPGRCDVKLSAAEIERLRGAHSIQEEFRRVVLDRVTQYLDTGFRSTADYVDHETPVDPGAVGSSLLTHSPWLTERAPRVAKYLAGFPSPTAADVQSFMYWLETTATPKPTIQVVHVSIDGRAGDGTAGGVGVIAPEMLVVSRQVFASHYINGSLALTGLFHDRSQSRYYIAYVNTMSLDGLSGWFGGIRRLFVARAASDRGAEAFSGLRTRIEHWRVSSASDQ